MRRVAKASTGERRDMQIKEVIPCAVPGHVCVKMKEMPVCAD